MKKLMLVLGAIAALYFAATLIVPPSIESPRNPFISPPPYTGSVDTQVMYERLDFISDLHCDALLWGRDLAKRGRTDE